VHEEDEGVLAALLGDLSEARDRSGRCSRAPDRL
jgi:hypothetical protein